MEGRRWFLGSLAAALAGGLGYLGLKEFHYTSPAGCYACRRAVHAHSRTVAMVNGRLRVFCCPACAFSEHEQGKEPVKVTQLASFLTGTALSPDAAYIVKGSDVNMCTRERAMIDPDKQPAALQYDRCLPSMYAFAEHNQAAEFAREHGGQIIPFRQLEAEFVK